MAKIDDAIMDVELRERFGLDQQEIDAGRRLRTFSREKLAIELHIGQVAFSACLFVRDALKLHSARFLTLMLASGNRAGKTAALAVVIIYACIDKTNRAKPVTQAEAARWLQSEYHWYHFGISQEVADLVYNDIVRIFSGTHPGQAGKDCPITAPGPVAQWDSKEYGDYRWIRFLPEWGGAEIHFRTTGEKALGSLGKDMHGVSFDEAGLERNLDFLIKEVFNLRRLGTGGQLIMVSTPSEELGTQFADNWRLGDPKEPKRLTSWRSLRMSTRDNVGYGISEDMFDRLIADMDDRTIRQNIDGEFLQSRAAYFHGGNVEGCFFDDLPVVSPAKHEMSYLQGVDPAKSQDSAWSIVLAIVKNVDDPYRPYLVGVRAAQRRGQKSTETIVAMAVDAHNAYDVARLSSHCYTAIDATGFGGKMFKEALENEIPTVFNVEFGGTVQKKRKLLGDLRTIIDEGRLILPSDGEWASVRRQLLGYKLEDRGIEQDAVMALVCAVYLLRRAPAEGVQSVPFDLTGQEDYGS